MFNHALMKTSGKCEIMVDSYKFEAAIENVNLYGSEISFEGRLLAPLFRPVMCKHTLENIMWPNENLYINRKSQAIPEIKNVIFNDPATIVFWSDGTKTVVKCQNNEIFDPEKGLAMAITKKFLGNKGNYCNKFKKWLSKGE